MTESENFREYRERAGMTLFQVAELSGYSVAAINALELSGKGSKRLKEKVLSILLQKEEEGDQTEIQYWRDRALKAENELNRFKSAMQALLKKN